eukprot:1574978-Rhodomonas_salina.1
MEVSRPGPRYPRYAMTGYPGTSVHQDWTHLFKLCRIAAANFAQSEIVNAPLAERGRDCWTPLTFFPQPPSVLQSEERRKEERP